MAFKFLLIIGGIFLVYFLLTSPAEIRKKKIKNFKKHLNFYFYAFIVLYLLALALTLFKGF